MTNKVDTYDIAIDSKQSPPTYTPPPKPNQGYQFAPKGLAQGTYVFTVDAGGPGIVDYTYKNSSGTTPGIVTSPRLPSSTPLSEVTFTFTFSDTATGHLKLKYANGTEHDPQVGNDGSVGG